MKTFFKIFLLTAIFVTSCDDVEPTIFNGNDPANGTFLSLSRSAYNLQIERDATGLLRIPVNVSTVAEVDRVYNIDVITDTADPQTYSVPSTVTVPAGEFQGFIEISGVDNGLVDNTKKTFTIKLSDDSLTTESLGTTQAVITVFEVCPLLADFTGTYQLTMVSSNFGPTDGPTFASGLVELSVGDTDYDRVFKANLYPGYVGSVDVVLNFACDYVNLGQTIDAGIGCSDNTTLQLQQTESPLTYNSSDDSVIQFAFVEDATGSCNATRQCVVKLTKVN